VGVGVEDIAARAEPGAAAAAAGTAGEALSTLAICAIICPAGILMAIYLPAVTPPSMP